MGKKRQFILNLISFILLRSSIDVYMKMKIFLFSEQILSASIIEISVLNINQRKYLVHENVNNLNMEEIRFWYIDQKGFF